MPKNNPDIYTLITVALISVASGVVGILNKVAHGHACSIAWVVSEFIAAVLCGYLAFDTYPAIVHMLPTWVGLPMFVAVCAYTGGKLLQTSGDLITSVANKQGGWK